MKEEEQDEDDLQPTVKKLTNVAEYLLDNEEKIETKKRKKRTVIDESDE